MGKKISSTNPMNRVISEGVQGIFGTNDALARAWRILLFQTGLTPQQWHSQLTKWELAMKKKMTTKKSASLKGNKTRMLAKSKVSWGSLLIGFSILDYEKLDIKFTLWKNGVPRELEISVEDLSQAIDLDEDTIDDES